MKLVIKVKRETKMINEIFEDLEGQDKGKMAKMQSKIIKAIYLKQLNLLFGIIRQRVSKWVVTESQEQFTAIQEGEESYVLQERDRLKRFLEGDEEQLKDNPDYKRYKNDRWVTRVLQFMKGRALKAKDYAMIKTLGSAKVIDFFTKAGLTISYELQTD